MKPEFIVQRDGFAYVLYAGLLDQAHEAGLVRVATTLLQAPDESLSCRAIVAAEVQLERGTFGGIGEAVICDSAPSPGSFLIDTAEVRAKAKALRDALNIHVDSVEERFGLAFGRDAECIGQENECQRPELVEEPVAPPKTSLPATSEETCTEAPARPATPNQLATIEKLSRLLDAGEEVTAGMSTVDASIRIAELARRFNDRGPVTRGSPAT